MGGGGGVATDQGVGKMKRCCHLDDRLETEFQFTEVRGVEVSWLVHRLKFFEYILE